jgi:uncharacterized protein (TIGR00304 family)
MRVLPLIPLLLVVIGIGLVVRAVLDGGATAYLLVIFPVVAGTSGLFLLGVILIVVGMVLTPFTLLDSAPRAQETPSLASSPPAATTGGVILIGPVPILFGAWRNISSRRRWGLAILGAAVLAVVILAILFA